MSGAVPPLPQYAFIAWCSGGARGQLYLLPLLYELFWGDGWEGKQIQCNCAPLYQRLEVRYTLEPASVKQEVSRNNGRHRTTSHECAMYFKKNPHKLIITPIVLKCLYRFAQKAKITCLQASVGPKGNTQTSWPPPQKAICFTNSFPQPPIQRVPGVLP
jgi:hypothetical protein